MSDFFLSRTLSGSAPAQHRNGCSSLWPNSVLLSGSATFLSICQSTDSRFYLLTLRTVPLCMLVHQLLRGRVFISLGRPPEWKRWSHGNSMFHFLRNCQTSQSSRTNHPHWAATLCPSSAFPLSPWAPRPRSLLGPRPQGPQARAQPPDSPVRGRGLERWTRAMSLLFSSLLGSRKGR